MAMGYFLRVGDKTTCGGEILSGDPTFTWNGEPTEVTSATEIPTIGMVGGWDMYINKMNRLYPNIQIIFEYTAAQQISELIFKINSKGSPE